MTDVTAEIKLAKRHHKGTITGAIYNDKQNRFVDGYMVNISNYDIISETLDDKGRPSTMLIKTTSGCTYFVELIETLDEVSING